MVAIYEIDTDLLTSFQTPMYHSLRNDGMTTEELLATGMFNNARVNIAEDIGGYAFSYFLYYEGDCTTGGVYHDIGAIVVVVKIRNNIFTIARE